MLKNYLKHFINIIYIVLLMLIVIALLTIQTIKDFIASSISLKSKNKMLDKNKNSSLVKQNNT